MDFVILLKYVLVASIFFEVLAMSMRAKAVDTIYFFRHPRLGMQAFAAMYVVVPAVAILLAVAFTFHPAVEIAMVASAFAPLAPILPGKQLKGGADLDYVTGLPLFSVIASLVAAPIGITLASRLFPGKFHVEPGDMIIVMLVTILGPMIIGLTLGKLLGERAPAVSAVIKKVATISLALGALALAVAMAPAFWRLLGNGTLLVFALFTAVALVAGYVLAGSVSVGDKTALALAASTRHPGIAIGIASATFPDERLAPAAIVLLLVVGVIGSIPFMKRVQSRREESLPSV